MYVKNNGGAVLIDRGIVAGGYGYSIFILYLWYIYPIFIVYLSYVVDKEKLGL